jgi:type IX secretion system PorP/SprF family membrane protein
MRKFITLVFLLSSLIFYGQSENIIHQSTFLQVVNPSYFGLNHLSKIGVLYNTSLVNQNDKIIQQYVFGSLSFPVQNFSLGFDVNSYKVQNVDLNSTLGRLSFVYKIQVDQHTYFLPAITLGFKNLTTRLPSLVFEDQINRTTGFISSETDDPLAEIVGRVNYADLEASFIVHSDLFFAGFSIKHLNQPNTSFDKEQVVSLPLALHLQGGLEMDINQYNRSFLPKNSFLFLYMGTRYTEGNFYANFAEEFQFDNFSIGLNQLVANTDQFTFNALGLNLGLKVENFDFGFQYNFSFQKANKVFAPSVFELFLVFDFSPFRRNQRGYLKRLQINNY